MARLGGQMECWHATRARLSARRGMRRLAPIATLVCVALFAAGCGSSATQTQPRRTQTHATTRVAPDPEARLLSGGIPQVVTRVEPAVVTVLTPGGGVGSGVIFRSDGVILTNDHVISGNKSVQIEFADGSRTRGDVIASDPDTDLALVRVAEQHLPTADFQTALPPVGALAIVIGSPLGFENSVTAGIVSGLHRSIPGSAAESPALTDLMQTDAPISPGNSGGAVVDAKGRVIGISEAYIPPEQGAVAIGFAIPAATAVSVADELLKTGRVEHAFIGIEPAQLTPEVAREFRLKQTSGVLVYGVVPGGPAAKAKLKPGDIIVALDGKQVATVEDLFGALRPKRPGDRVTLGLVRDGQRLNLVVRLSGKPPQPR